jgi:uncharacterized protein
VIAVDTNILTYAHRRDSPWHAKAFDSVRSLAEGRQAWAIPWPCVHEFIAAVTNPRIMKPATPMTAAVAQMEAWMESGTLSLLTESDSHWTTLKGLFAASTIAGAQVHDARIAALCLQYGVSELLTADRDFTRFPALKTRNPLIG